jgi:Zn-dependent protease
VHIDPIGTVLLPLVALLTGAPLLGWAKPVPVSTRYLRRYPRDFILVAAAGPASNALIALVASWVRELAPERLVSPGGLDVASPLTQLLAAAFQLNLLLMVFNMIPVPPLDGGNILGALLRGRLSQRFEAVRPYGVLILYALMLTGALAYILRPPYRLLERLFTL